MRLAVVRDMREARVLADTEELNAVQSGRVPLGY
jgi:hypothetical protein